MNKNFTYFDINWNECTVTVEKLQNEILEAYKLGNYKKVTYLQQVLVKSFSARALSVRKITRNKTSPGIDGIVVQTAFQKLTLIEELRNLSNYKANGIKRVFIPKRDGSKRPLGIPTMKDRAVQALYLLSLEPIAEFRADPRSYGFRKYRSAQDLCLIQRLGWGCTKIFENLFKFKR